MALISGTKHRRRIAREADPHRSEHGARALRSPSAGVTRVTEAVREAQHPSAGGSGRRRQPRSRALSASRYSYAARTVLVLQWGRLAPRQHLHDRRLLSFPMPKCGVSDRLGRISEQRSQQPVIVVERGRSPDLWNNEEDFFRSSASCARPIALSGRECWRHVRAGCRGQPDFFAATEVRAPMPALSATIR